MNRLLAISVLLITSLIVIGGTGVAHAIDYKIINWKDCAFGKCFEYAQTNPHLPKLTTGTNVAFDIFMPDGTCNITGHIDTKGNCSTSQIILSQDNLTALKQNPAAMTVTNIHSVSNSPNTNYCPVAYFTVTHEDGYFYIIQNVLKFVFPDYCYQEIGPVVIPEFGLVAGIVLVISVMSVIILTVKRK